MNPEEYTLLGVAVSKAQTIEFAIYGILTHLKKEPEIVKDKRLRDLTPRQFLSADPADKEKRKMTLGQLNRALPDEFGLDPDFLQEYIERRNIVVHEFMRETNPKYATGAVIDAGAFLTKFIQDSGEFEQVILGLLYVMMDHIADINSLPDRKPKGTDVDKAKSAFYSHVANHRSEQAEDAKPDNVPS